MEQKLSDADYIRLFDLAKRVALRTGVTSSCDAEDIAHDVLVGLLRKLKQPSPHRIACREVSLATIKSPRMATKSAQLWPTE
jgi:hypothetical protein